jgi:V/A-type H+-transporting ATPase subunit A
MTIYDGIQRPLAEIQKLSGRFIDRGVRVDSLNREKLWDFTPADLSVGTEITGGMILGTVQETETVLHKILVPPDVKGTLTSIVSAGAYTVDEKIAVVATDKGEKNLTMMQRWSIRTPRPTRERLPTSIPLITGQRVVDTLFPIARGSTIAIPGGFGTGKTMTQHAIAKWCDASIIVYIGCGERGNEMTDVLEEFPKLIDSRTGKSLMEPDGANNSHCEHLKYAGFRTRSQHLYRNYAGGIFPRSGL